MGRDDISMTEAELQLVRQRSGRVNWLLAIVGNFGIASLTVPAAIFGFALGDGATRYLYTALFAVLLGSPVTLLAMLASRKQEAATAAAMDSLRDELTNALVDADREAVERETQARAQEFESRLTNALEMAADEIEVIDVVERAFSATVGAADAELLLADNSHAHLTRMAASASAAGAPMCGVESPDQCPAARRAQVQRFGDSEALDACPKLRDRAAGRCCAVCVPVSIMGRTVGVIHVTGAVGALPADRAVHDLSTLAKQARARLGLLRVMADTQLQASTDSLTGLLNRRAFENAVRHGRTSGAPFAVAMADLDHFKNLNDTYGHDTGDRALRLFAQTLRANLREHDIVSRFGGEEFAMVLPSCTAQAASEILDRLRIALVRVTAEAGLPTVTASFGVVDGDEFEELSVALARADAALLEAKRAGRDRVVRHVVPSDAQQLDAWDPITA